MHALRDGAHVDSSSASERLLHPAGYDWPPDRLQGVGPPVTPSVTCILSGVSELSSSVGIVYPVRPMLAEPALQLPTCHPGGWAAEPKLDGFIQA
jgi:hypothetical protein